ncbi:MAG: hypothetical protein ABI939_07370 [Anaerolineaceae bacterium]
MVFVVCAPVLAQAPPLGGSSQAARNQLNPLSAAEQQAAERIATGDSRVREFTAAARTRVVYVELANVKPEPDGISRRDAGGSRFAEVLQYRYNDDSGLRILVDLQRKEVRAVERLEGGSVPLTRADLEDAVKLALASPEVRELLGSEARQYVVPAPAATKNPPYAIRALLVQSLAENDPCYRRRCVHLFFQRRGAYLTGAAIVDLTENRVRIERGVR